MSTKLLGKDYMLWLETATAGTYALIAGQGDLSITRNAAKIDTTSKDDLGYGTSAPGLRDLSITLNIIPKLPDANGYTRLETQCNASPQAPFNIQVRSGGATGTDADAVFECSVFGNLDGTDFAQGAAVNVKAGFYAAAAPTIDVLS